MVIDMIDIKQLVENALNESVISVEPLLGGMSNYNYVVKTKNYKLVVRVPGDNSKKFVNREIEKYHVDFVEHSKVNQEILYFDVESGVKIAKYVEGQSLDNCDFSINELTSLFKSYHKLKSDYDYNPFKRLELFESYLSNQSNKYFELKMQLEEYKDYLLKQETVFCHNDSQPLNMIKSDDKIYLLDWEFAGNNDPMYDLVCFTEDFGADSNFSDKLIKNYFGYIDNDLIKRKLLWTVFQSLQWYNVALYKDNEGMSEKLHIDFLEVCDYFLSTSEAKLKELRRIENEG